MHNTDLLRSGFFYSSILLSLLFIHYTSICSQSTPEIQSTLLERNMLDCSKEFQLVILLDCSWLEVAWLVRNWPKYNGVVAPVCIISAQSRQTAFNQQPKFMMGFLNYQEESSIRLTKQKQWSGGTSMHCLSAINANST